MNEDQTLGSHISLSQLKHFLQFILKYHKIISNKGRTTIEQKILMKSLKMYLRFHTVSI